MKKYFYLIPKIEIVYDMIRYHLMSLHKIANPGREEIIAEKEEMRCVVDTTDSVEYVIIEMGLDFSTPFKGYPAYCSKAMAELLSDQKWEHNQ